MNAGRLEQEGTPAEIYREPRSTFVADFIGRCNRLPGRVISADQHSRTVRLQLDAGGEVDVS